MIGLLDAPEVDRARRPDATISRPMRMAAADEVGGAAGEQLGQLRIRDVRRDARPVVGPRRRMDAE